jgi:hypothetical protein
MIMQEAAINREFNIVRPDANRQSELDPNMQTDRHGNQVVKRVRHTSIYEDFPPLERDRQSDLRNQGASLRPRTLNLETPVFAPAPVTGWNGGGRAEIPIDSPIIPPATGASSSSSMSGATKNEKLVEKNRVKLAQYTGRTVNGRDKMAYEDHREIFDNAIDIAPHATDEAKGIWFRMNMNATLGKYAMQHMGFSEDGITRRYNVAGLAELDAWFLKSMYADKRDKTWF